MRTLWCDRCPCPCCLLIRVVPPSSATPALVDKSPMVAGAIKTIDEVKKLARHSSSPHHEPIPHHHESFFDSAFHGWGDKKKLEEGWKLTHGQESVHESAAVRKAEAASRAAARGDADSGDGFFDSWGKVTPKAHIGGKITESTPLMTSPSAPSAQTSSAPATTSAATKAPQTHAAEGGASESSLEPPPLPSFLQKGVDPLSDTIHAAKHDKDKDNKAHGGGGGGTDGGGGSAKHAQEDSGSRGKGDEGARKHTGGGARGGGREEVPSKKSESKPQDPIDKLIALQRLKRKQKEKALVRSSVCVRACVRACVRERVRMHGCACLCLRCVGVRACVSLGHALRERLLLGDGGPSLCRLPLSLVALAQVVSGVCVQRGAVADGGWRVLGRVL